MLQTAALTFLHLNCPETVQTEQNFSIVSIWDQWEEEGSSSFPNKAPSQNPQPGQGWEWEHLTVGLSSLAPEGWKEWLVLPQRYLTVLGGFARHSYTQSISRNRWTPLKTPLYSPFSLLPCRPNPHLINHRYMSNLQNVSRLKMCLNALLFLRERALLRILPRKLEPFSCKRQTAWKGRNQHNKKALCAVFPTPVVPTG